MTFSRGTVGRQPARRRGVRRLPGADGLRRCNATQDSITVDGRAAHGHRRRHERDQRHGANARRRRAVCRGPTTIRNVAHIRHKETDRIAAVATELRKLGAEVIERDDGLTIEPGQLAAGHDRHLQRSPHGDELRAGRAADARRADRESEVRREDVPGVSLTIWQQLIRALQRSSNARCRLLRPDRHRHDVRHRTCRSASAEDPIPAAAVVCSSCSARSNNDRLELGGG